MRFVPSNCIREGMILGDDLYNNVGNLMLSQGQVLTTEYIESIKRLNFNGLYIDDDISKDIEIINLISDKVKAESVKAIRNTFIYGEKESKLRKKDVDLTKGQINLIVNEILNHKELMVNMIDLKVFDDYTYYHSVNVAVLSIVIGVALGIAKDELCVLGFAAILHDIGKVFIDKNILNKPSRLTPEEFNIMKTHSLLGCDHVKNSYGVSLEAYMGILDHHEHFGGTGYPNGYEKNRISLYGRIIAVADVYDALTSDRPYRRALIPSEAMEYIMGSSMTLFDPELVEIFVRKIAPYPVGTCVRLSNGLVGIVLENNEELNMRPKIRIFQNGESMITPYEIQLSDYEVLNVTVVGVV
ncbi:HD-GYP domain-containing protein [Bacillota bacterium]